MADQIFLALGWLGAGLAALFGAALLTRRAGASERWLGAGFLAAAVAAVLITISHSGWKSGGLEAAEVAVTLAAGPLVALWFLVGAGRKPSTALTALALLPAAAWTALAGSGAPFASDARAIRGAVVFQMLGTVAGAVIFFAARRRLGTATRRTFTAALVGLGLLHASQVARLVGPRSTPRNLVPATMGVLLGGLTLAALRRTRLPLGAGATGGVSEEEAGVLVGSLDAWLTRNGAFLESGVTVAAAARALRVPATRLSRALNRQTGRSFSEYVTALRVAEAKRLLADRSLSHLSVEAVGGRAGFRSRSVFYAEFRRATGSTPAAFREEGGAGSR